MDSYDSQGMELIQGVKKTDKARFLKLKAGKTSS